MGLCSIVWGISSICYYMEYMWDIMMSIKRCHAHTFTHTHTSTPHTMQKKEGKLNEMNKIK